MGRFKHARRKKKKILAHDGWICESVFRTTSLLLPLYPENYSVFQGNRSVSSWWWVFHSFPLWTYDDLRVQDPAHVCSRKPLFSSDSLHYGASTWAKTLNNRFCGDIPEFPLKSINLYHDHKMQKLLLHVWCLMLECVSIVAGMIVVSGPSKLEFGDVLGQWLQGHLYVYVCNIVYL